MGRIILQMKMQRGRENQSIIQMRLKGRKALTVNKVILNTVINLCILPIMFLLTLCYHTILHALNRCIEYRILKVLI